MATATGSKASGAAGRIGSATTTNIEQFFTLDENSGEIRVADTLDYERDTAFSFTVVARDRGEPGATSMPTYAQVEVYKFFVTKNNTKV